MTSVEAQLIAAVGACRGTEAADRLCEACVSVLGIDAAAIALVFDGANIGTLGASTARARVFDEVQFTFGEGPCLDAVAQRAPVMVVDLADTGEVRWPAYTPAMLAHQIRGVLAIPVTVAGACVGALDLFLTRPQELRADQLAGLGVAAGLAQLPLLDMFSADLHAAATDPCSDAWAELNSLTRAEVSQATGMVMAQLNIEAPAALARLRAHAYATDRTATDVARDIVERRLRLEQH